MAYNASVVNDGLSAPYKQTVKFAGLANCGGVRRGSERSDRLSRLEPLQPCRLMALAASCPLCGQAHIPRVIHSASTKNIYE
jgi:hypothetical protein